MRIKSLTILSAASIALAGCGTPGEEDSAASGGPLASDMITANSFGCIRDMSQVGRFFVDNLDGDLEATLAVANSETGGVYPVGSVVQLVPSEVMVKRAAGFSEATKDWEFFILDNASGKTKISTRGHEEVVNRFGDSCLSCHEKAEPQWDLVCQLDHGCDPIPINDAMIRALQKTDPRCEVPAELTEEEAEGLQTLMAMMGG